MTSLILRTTTKCLFPVILLFSLYLLFRGHNEPGGGFVGGLAAASAFTLYALAFDVGSARQLLRLDSRWLIAAGLALAAGSSLFTALGGRPFLTSAWGRIRLPPLLDLPVGTPLLFDIGVYLVVLGVTLTIILALGERDAEDA